MKYSDETLMAYADGELDAETRAAIEAAAATDPQLAKAIARHREMREQVRQGFAPILDEAVPARLLAAAKAGHAPERNPGNVTPMRARPTERAPIRWSWPVWGAMAATLVLGALIGVALRTTPSALFETHNEQLVAAGELDRALSTQLASDRRTVGEVRPGISFRTVDGEYCRTFAVGASAGLACREAEQWRIDLLEKLPAAEIGIDRYRMAGVELPRAIRDTVDARIDGDPLDAAEEAAARDRGWTGGAGVGP
jgi:hypothetical protein